jgi:hypothetical protein
MEFAGVSLIESTSIPTSSLTLKSKLLHLDALK